MAAETRPTFAITRALTTAPRLNAPPEGSAPAEQPGRGGAAAADQEAGDRGADDHGALVLSELTPPVRELADLSLEVVQRVLELRAGGLERVADLLRRAARHQPRASSSTARVFFASSIASSGLGGVAFLKKRTASRPAIAPSTDRTPVVTR